MTQDHAGKAYTAPDITVYFDATRCRHFAECIRGLPGVFDTAARPWIRADAAEPQTVAEVVRRCPTGALHYSLRSGPPENGGPRTSVAPLDDGALLIRGSLRIRSGADGTWTDETRMAACGCGRSANRPFCDGACQHAGSPLRPLG